MRTAHINGRRELIPLIDIFAGPGGLSEGFNSLRSTEGKPLFESKAAIEMEASAVATLSLRGAFRHLDRTGRVPDVYFDYLRHEVDRTALESNSEFADALNESDTETHQLELGPSNHEVSDTIIRRAIDGHPDWVLIGGPPCQAYSLVGRSRRANDALFEEDKKHFLYREYLHTIREFQPAVFVMENVKGLLSSTHGGTSMFARILSDLAEIGNGPGYDIYSLVSDTEPTALKPKDFIIRAEDYGVPQRRHRVILLGVRRGQYATPSTLSPWAARNTVSSAIGDMPAIRSVISRGADSPDQWNILRRANQEKSRDWNLVADEQILRNLDTGRRGRLGTDWSGPRDRSAAKLHEWLTDSRIDGVTDHASRRHMAPDLARYYFAARFAAENGRSPRIADFPSDLIPAHKSATSSEASFVDRFNVQVWDRPSSTIVSHMAKDGNYYIHPDPTQMRTLTVREAARLQTFPDNYAFEGTQTQQYVQVGNAVPPLLARQIGEIVHDIVSKPRTVRSSKLLSEDESSMGAEIVRSPTRSQFVSAPQRVPVTA
jgi:DNA (cytosine-5)-methyltransferase 1